MGVLRPHWARPSQALPQLSVCRVNARPRFKGNGLASPAVAGACGTSYTPGVGGQHCGEASAPWEPGVIPFFSTQVPHLPLCP